MMYKIKVIRMSEHARLPEYAHPGDAGMDVFSAVDKLLKAGESALIGTGIKIELPENTEAQIRPRSGLALKTGLPSSILLEQ
jgi:dUTP pyrophosphatase